MNFDFKPVFSDLVYPQLKKFQEEIIDAICEARNKWIMDCAARFLSIEQMKKAYGTDEDKALLQCTLYSKRMYIAQDKGREFFMFEGNAVSEFHLSFKC